MSTNSALNPLAPPWVPPRANSSSNPQLLCASSHIDFSQSSVVLATARLEVTNARSSTQDGAVSPISSPLQSSTALATVRLDGLDFRSYTTADVHHSGKSDESPWCSVALATTTSAVIISLTSSDASSTEEDDACAASLPEDQTATEAFLASEVKRLCQNRTVWLPPELLPQLPAPKLEESRASVRAQHMAVKLDDLAEDAQLELVMAKTQPNCGLRLFCWLHKCLRIQQNMGRQAQRAQKRAAESTVQVTSSRARVGATESNLSPVAATRDADPQENDLADFIAEKRYEPYDSADNRADLLTLRTLFYTDCTQLGKKKLTAHKAEYRRLERVVFGRSLTEFITKDTNLYSQQDIEDSLQELLQLQRISMLAELERSLPENEALRIALNDRVIERRRERSARALAPAIERAFRNALAEKHKLKVARNKGDGNCLIHALLRSLPANIHMSPLQLRHVVADYLMANKEKYYALVSQGTSRWASLAAFSQYLQDMHDHDFTFCDEVFLLGFCDLFHRRVLQYVIGASLECPLTRFFVGGDESQATRPIIAVVLTGGNHFESLIGIQGEAADVALQRAGRSYQADPLVHVPISLRPVDSRDEALMAESLKRIEEDNRRRFQPSGTDAILTPVIGTKGACEHDHDYRIIEYYHQPMIVSVFSGANVGNITCSPHESSVQVKRGHSRRCGKVVHVYLGFYKDQAIARGNTKVTQQTAYDMMAESGRISAGLPIDDGGFFIWGTQNIFGGSSRKLPKNAGPRTNTSRNEDDVNVDFVFTYHLGWPAVIGILTKDIVACHYEQELIAKYWAGPGDPTAGHVPAWAFQPACEGLVRHRRAFFLLDQNGQTRAHVTESQRAELFEHTPVYDDLRSFQHAALRGDILWSTLQYNAATSNVYRTCRPEQYADRNISAFCAVDCTELLPMAMERVQRELKATRRTHCYTTAGVLLFCSSEFAPEPLTSSTFPTYFDHFGHEPDCSFKDLCTKFSILLAKNPKLNGLRIAVRRAGTTPVIYDVASQAPGNRLLCLELDEDTGSITPLNYIPLETSDRVISQDSMFHSTNASNFNLRSSSKQTSMNQFASVKIALPASQKSSDADSVFKDSASAAATIGKKARAAKMVSATAAAATDTAAVFDALIPPSALKQPKKNRQTDSAASEPNGAAEKKVKFQFNAATAAVSRPATPPHHPQGHDSSSGASGGQIQQVKAHRAATPPREDRARDSSPSVGGAGQKPTQKTTQHRQGTAGQGSPLLARTLVGAPILQRRDAAGKCDIHVFPSELESVLPSRNSSQDRKWHTGQNSHMFFSWPVSAQYSEVNYHSLQLGADVNDLKGLVVTETNGILITGCPVPTDMTKFQSVLNALLNCLHLLPHGLNLDSVTHKINRGENIFIPKLSSPNNGCFWIPLIEGKTVAACLSVPVEYPVYVEGMLVPRLLEIPLKLPLGLTRQDPVTGAVTEHPAVKQRWTLMAQPMQLQSEDDLEGTPLLYVTVPDEFALLPDALATLEIIVSRIPVGNLSAELQARQPHRLRIVVQRRFLKAKGSTPKEFITYRRTIFRISLTPGQYGHKEEQEVAASIMKFFHLNGPTAVTILQLGMHIMACASTLSVIESYVNDHCKTFMVMQARALILPGADDQKCSSQLRAMLNDLVMLPFGGVHPVDDRLPVLLSTVGSVTELDQLPRPQLVKRHEVRLQLSVDPTVDYASAIAQMLGSEPSRAITTGLSLEEMKAQLSPFDIFKREQEPALPQAPLNHRITPLTTEDLLRRQLNILPRAAAAAASRSDNESEQQLPKTVESIETQIRKLQELQKSLLAQNQPSASASSSSEPSATYDVKNG